MAKITTPKSDPSRLARAIAAELPPPPKSRARMVPMMLRLSDQEADLLRRAAASHGVPPATMTRDLAVAAARVMLGGGEES